MYVLLILIGCSKNSSDSMFSPSPEILIQDPVYQDQILRIDQDRVKKEMEAFSELIEQNRVTKTPNGTEPIVIKIETPKFRPDSNKPILDEKGEEILEPLHGRQEIEEYYVLKKAEERVSVKGQGGLDANVNASAQAGNSESSIKSDDFEDLEKKKEKEEIFNLRVQDNIGEDVAVKVKNKVNLEEVDRKEVDIEAKKAPIKEEVVKKESIKKMASYKADWDGRSIEKPYTQYTLEALKKYGANLLNPNHKIKEYERYCKKYNSLNKDERTRFWLVMVSGLSRLESFPSFNTHSKSTEKFKPHKKAKDYVISRGLMQLSIDSIKGSYYKCHKKLDINKAQDLHDPQKNLACSVVIMNHWVGSDKKIYGFEWRKCKDGTDGCRTWFGVGRYWSPLRVERESGQKKEKYLGLAQKTNGLNFCR